MIYRIAAAIIAGLTVGTYAVSSAQDISMQAAFGQIVTSMWDGARAFVLDENGEGQTATALGEDASPEEIDQLIKDLLAAEESTGESSEEGALDITPAVLSSQKDTKAVPQPAIKTVSATAPVAAPATTGPIPTSDPVLLGESYVEPVYNATYYQSYSDPCAPDDYACFNQCDVASDGCWFMCDPEYEDCNNWLQNYASTDVYNTYYIYYDEPNRYDDYDLFYRPQNVFFFWFNRSIYFRYKPYASSRRWFSPRHRYRKPLIDFRIWSSRYYDRPRYRDGYRPDRHWDKYDRHRHDPNRRIRDWRNDRDRDRHRDRDRDRIRDRDRERDRDRNRRADGTSPRRMDGDIPPPQLRKPQDIRGQNTVNGRNRDRSRDRGRDQRIADGSGAAGLGRPRDGNRRSEGATANDAVMAMLKQRGLNNTQAKQLMSQLSPKQVEAMRTSLARSAASSAPKVTDQKPGLFGRKNVHDAKRSTSNTSTRKTQGGGKTHNQRNPRANNRAVVDLLKQRGLSEKQASQAVKHMSPQERNALRSSLQTNRAQTKGPDKTKSDGRQTARTSLKAKRGVSGAPKKTTGLQPNRNIPARKATPTPRKRMPSKSASVAKKNGADTGVVDLLKKRGLSDRQARSAVSHMSERDKAALRAATTKARPVTKSQRSSKATKPKVTKSRAQSARTWSQKNKPSAAKTTSPPKKVKPRATPSRTSPPKRSRGNAFSQPRKATGVGTPKRPTPSAARSQQKRTTPQPAQVHKNRPPQKKANRPLSQKQKSAQTSARKQSSKQRGFSQASSARKQSASSRKSSNKSSKNKVSRKGGKNGNGKRGGKKR